MTSNTNEQPNMPIPDYDEIFNYMCKKFNVAWDTADEKEKYFVLEVTRVTYEIRLAEATGTSKEHIRPSFIAPD